MLQSNVSSDPEASIQRYSCSELHVTDISPPFISTVLTKRMIVIFTDLLVVIITVDKPSRWKRAENVPYPNN